MENKDGKSEKAENSTVLNQTELLDFGDKIELLSGLLDYYASRATSFASLFIAAFFGVVALSAIIRVIDMKNWGMLCYALSFIPYFAFIALTWTTWKRFQYWKDIADKIERDGLRHPIQYQNFLKTIKVFETNLYDYIDSKYLKADKGFWRRNTVNKLGKIFFITIIFLTLTVYWNFFFELFKLVGLLN
jgi:hypothetical protein